MRILSHQVRTAYSQGGRPPETVTVTRNTGNLPRTEGGVMLSPDEHAGSGVTRRRWRRPVVMLGLAGLAGPVASTGFVAGVASGAVAGASASIGSTYSAPACQPAGAGTCPSHAGGRCAVGLDHHVV